MSIINSEAGQPDRGLVMAQCFVNAVAMILILSCRTGLLSRGTIEIFAWLILHHEGLFSVLWDV